MLSLLDAGHDILGRSQSKRADSSANQPRLAITTCGDHPEFLEPSIALEDEIWEDMSFLDFTNAHHAHYGTLLDKFADYRLCLFDRDTHELLATGMCVPLCTDKTQALPNEGWDWLVETAVEQGGRKANTIGGLSVSVSKKHRDKGFARDLINTMRAVAAMRRCDRVVVAVRPNEKTFHQTVAMKDYIQWTDTRGRMFDPWLRSHLAVGGRLKGVCERSMVVEQPLEFWQEWTSVPLDQTTAIPLKGALVPLEIDAEAGVGRYIEPNVWVEHAV
jgi:GNAT superfamily N-acetyltransferase